MKDMKLENTTKDSKVESETSHKFNIKIPYQNSILANVILCFIHHSQQK